VAAIANIVRRTPAVRAPAALPSSQQPPPPPGDLPSEAPVAMTHAQALSLSLPPPSEDAGWSVPLDAAAAASTTLPPRPPRVHSRGGALAKALRRHMAVQTAHRKVFRQLRTLRRLHARGEHADASLEVDFACPACLKVMLPSKVRTLWPCGHALCSDCAAAAVRSADAGCDVCGRAATRAGPNPLAARIISSHRARKQALSDGVALMQKYHPVLAPILDRSDDVLAAPGGGGGGGGSAGGGGGGASRPSRGTRRRSALGGLLEESGLGS
jgi:hypothetical protein